MTTSNNVKYLENRSISLIILNNLRTAIVSFNINFDILLLPLLNTNDRFSNLIFLTITINYSFVQNVLRVSWYSILMHEVATSVEHHRLTELLSKEKREYSHLVVFISSEN